MERKEKGKKEGEGAERKYEKEGSVGSRIPCRFSGNRMDTLHIFQTSGVKKK